MKSEKHVQIETALGQTQALPATLQMSRGWKPPSRRGVGWGGAQPASARCVGSSLGRAGSRRPGGSVGRSLRPGSGGRNAGAGGSGGRASGVSPVPPHGALIRARRQMCVTALQAEAGYSGTWAP